MYKIIFIIISLCGGGVKCEYEYTTFMKDVWLAGIGGEATVACNT